MLDKILSRYKSTPGYTARLREFTLSVSKERFIRGLGVLLILVALVLQVFAALAPSQSSAAPSQNDLIPGGVTSKSQLVKDCDKNTNKIDRVLNYYSIKCVDLAKGKVVSLNSRDYNGRLYSAGHLPQGYASETPVNIGSEVIYWRLLHAWDTHKSSTYTTLKFTSSKGKTFWMLFTCGNLVSIGLPKGPPPPKTCPYNDKIPAKSPKCRPCKGSPSEFYTLACLTYHKTVVYVKRHNSDANGTTAKPGDVLKYALIVKNTGKRKQPNFVIQDNIADILEYAVLTNRGGGTYDKSTGFLSFPKVNIKPGATVTRTFSVTVDNPLPTTRSLSDPDAYNYKMTNVFGDIINVKVQPPTAQVVIANAATSLPNTGPGTSIFTFAAIAAIAGYFYSNRRLQLKEARLALELSSGGQEVE